MRIRTALLLASGGLASLSTIPAFAQDLTTAASRAPGNQRDVEASVYDASVQGRDAILTEQTGLPLGAFTVLPQILVDSEYTTNVYATDSNAVGDAFFTIRPEVAIAGDQSHSALGARAYYSRTLFAHYTTEDTSDYGASTDTRFDLAANTRLSIDASVDREAESRSSLGSFRQASKPAEFTQFGGQAVLDQQFGPASLSLIGRGYRLTYSDALIGDVEESQKYRNFNVYDLALQGGYALDATTALVVRATRELRRYDLRPGDPGFDPLTLTDRSTDGVRLEAGVSREITSLLSLQLRGGYLHYNYADPKLRDVSSFSFYGNLLWNVTALTSISASAERRLDETTSPLTAGNLRDEFKLTVAHELLRSLILDAHLRYASITPAGLAPSSREFSGDIGARYRIGRSIALTAEVAENQRTSVDHTIAFHEFRAEFGVRFYR